VVAMNCNFAPEARLTVLSVEQRQVTEQAENDSQVDRYDTQQSVRTNMGVQRSTNHMTAN